MSVYTDLLKRIWGYDSFRPLQEDIILSVCKGKDTLGLLPTGGGKSMTFQVATLSMQGICIVVTPLIALMKDQVASLRKKKIKAAAIYSGMRRSEIVTTLDNCILGGYRFLYVSPERLSTDLFIDKLRQMEVCLLTIDESHCISQWGYDFRPSYLKISAIRERLPGVPVLALTATATPEVVKDIQARLLFSKENVFQTSFQRPNISYQVIKSNSKEQDLLQLINEVSEGSIIVYVRSRKRTKETALFLVAHAIKAHYYHAGLPFHEKNKKQKEWQDGEKRVMVSTNAFGMGIDKSDVRLVVHLDLPDSPEAYFQETGRAGRDTLYAKACLLYNKNDMTQLKKRVTIQFPQRDYIKTIYEELCNFLNIPIGEGFEAIFDFDLAFFCHNFNRPLLPTYYAIKLLQQAGYFEYVEEQNTQPRVFFRITRDSLYDIKGLCEGEINLLNHILRRYTGFFSEFVAVNEDIACEALALTRPEIYDLFVLLAKKGIISFIPRKRTPMLILKERRVDPKYILISSLIYEDRKKRMEQRISAMLDFVQMSKGKCRTQYLLRYFGEKEAQPCGNCDLCKAQEEFKTENNSTICEQVQVLLEKESMSINKLISLLPISREEALPLLRRMVEYDLITLDGNRLSFFKK